MRSFVVKFVVVLGLVFVIDLIVGKVMDRLITDLPSKESETSIMYRSLFSEKAEVLVLGASTANHHYNTKILSDSLGYTAYNAGMDGHDLIYSDIVFESFLERNKLEVVIIDIGVSNVDGRWKNHYGKFKQYYGRNKYVTGYFDLETGWIQRVKLSSNIYRYNGTMHSAISLLLFNRAEDSNNGYRPLNGCHSFTFNTVYGFHPDSDILKHLLNIVKKCKDNQIKLLLVKSPYCDDNPDFNAWLKNFGEEYTVPVLFENQNPFWKTHPELFYDGSHLNTYGADTLTNRVCKQIKYNL